MTNSYIYDEQGTLVNAVLDMNGRTMPSLSPETFLHKVDWSILSPDYGSPVDENTLMYEMGSHVDIAKIRDLCTSIKRSCVLIYTTLVDGCLGLFQSIAHEHTHLSFFIGQKSQLKVFENTSVVYCNASNVYMTLKKTPISRNKLSHFPHKSFSNI